MSRRSWSVRRAVGLVAVLSCLLLAQVAPSAGADRSVAVGQGGDRFTPARVEIVAGDTVVWTNHGGWHNVHGDGFSNAVSDTSWTFRHTFSSPGTFDYVCDVHPNMRGTVVVSAAPAPPAETEPAPAPTEPAPAPTSTAPAPAPVASSEPADGGPTASEPRPQPTDPGDPEATSADSDAPSERPSPSPLAAPTTEPAGTAPAEAASPDPAPTATIGPSVTPRFAAPASDAGGTGGAAAAVVVVALLLAAAGGGVWVVRSRRHEGS